MQTPEYAETTIAAATDADSVAVMALLTCLFREKARQTSTRVEVPLLTLANNSKVKLSPPLIDETVSLPALVNATVASNNSFPPAVLIAALTTVVAPAPLFPVTVVSCAAAKSIDCQNVGCLGQYLRKVRFLNGRDR